MKPLGVVSLCCRVCAVRVQQISAWILAVAGLRGLGPRPGGIDTYLLIFHRFTYLHRYVPT